MAQIHIVVQFSDLAVTCGNPLISIYSTGGFYTGRYQGDRVGDLFTFTCPPTQRMLGSETRICMEDGQWSGLLTKCDDIVYEGQFNIISANKYIVISKTVEFTKHSRSLLIFLQATKIWINMQYLLGQFMVAQTNIIGTVIYSLVSDII